MTTTIRESDHYLLAAIKAIEIAGQQGHAPVAMEAHTRRASALLELYGIVLQRELSGAEPGAEEAEPVQDRPVAVLDAHDRLWELRGAGIYRCGPRGADLTYAALAAQFGPLRPVEETR